MSDGVIKEEIELAGPQPKLSPKEWVDKRLADEEKTRNPQPREKIAEFLATQDGATDYLVELLNRTNLTREEKEKLINQSCESTNRWAGYMHGRWPGDKGEQIIPAKYYELLKEEKIESTEGKKKTVQPKVQPSPIKKAA